MPANSFLLVDDDPGAIQVMHKAICGVGHTRFATSGAEALRLANESEPHLILLDAEMPGMSGFQVIEQLKRDRRLCEVPVIMVTAHDNEDFQLAGYKSGVADFIVKPLNPKLALARIMALLNARRQAQATARLLTVDPLTEVANWRGFESLLYREWRRSLRCGEPISTLIVEVDGYDALRSSRGSRVAEHCLKEIGRCLQGVALQPDDVVGRISHHSFGVLLPSTARAGARYMADRIMEAVRDLALDRPDQPLTVSVGVASYDGDSPVWAGAGRDGAVGARPGGPPEAWMLLNAADAALRQARRSGRACVRAGDVADVAPVVPPSSAATAAPAAGPARPRGGFFARQARSLRQALDITAAPF